MFTEFIKISTGCVVACEQCLQACLMEGEALGCCRYCIDCSTLGTLAGKMASAKSPLTDDILMLFAKSCDACARECEKHEMNHHHCKVCAEACRASSRLCREMMVQMRD